MLNQRLFQLERLDLLSEERGMEIDKAPLIEIACGISTIGDGRCIAQSSDAGKTRLILRLYQLSGD